MHTSVTKETYVVNADEENDSENEHEDTCTELNVNQWNDACTATHIALLMIH